MTKSVEVRIPYRLALQLREEVYRPGEHEYVSFGLISHSETRDRILVLVQEVIRLGEDDYQETRLHGAMWRGASTVGIINRAMEKQLGIVLFHSHFHHGAVGLSTDDLKSVRSLLPVYQNLIPKRPHGSVVVSLDCAAGMVLLPDEDNAVEISSLRWMGDAIADWTPTSPDKDIDAAENRYHRQMLMIGGAGQKKLEASIVAVIGLSGGGSHVVQQLAHLGVGEIIGVDPDRSGNQNRHRVIGMTKRDASKEKLKTDVMQRMVSQINEDVKFTPAPYLVTEDEAIQHVKRADVVIGCVDSLHSRSDIQALCLRYVIPYVDIGLLIVPKRDGKGIESIGGNIVKLIPGKSCMWCVRFLSPQRLAEEAGGLPRTYFQGSDKQAQVVSFNGLLASAAVNECLQLLTGFAPVGDAVTIKKFDGLRNTVEEWDVEPIQNCQVCGHELAAGDPVWKII